MDEGAAEYADVDADALGGGVAHLDNLTFEAGHGAADDTDMVALGDDGGEEDGTLGTVEHELEGLYLLVRDDGDGVGTILAWGGGFVDHEGLDEGEVDNLTALFLGGMDEDDGGNLDGLNNLPGAVPPTALFLLGGYEGFVAEALEPVARGSLGILAYEGNEPMAHGRFYGLRFTDFGLPFTVYGWSLRDTQIAQIIFYLTQISQITQIFF